MSEQKEDRQLVTAQGKALDMAVKLYPKKNLHWAGQHRKATLITTRLEEKKISNFADKFANIKWGPTHV